MANKQLKKLRKKLKKQAKKELGILAHEGVSQLVGKAPIPKTMQASITRQIQSKVDKALAHGSGAYGRGAYGRGSYDMSPATNVKVNSLFNEYSNRRHRTSEVGDETGRIRVSRREYVMRVVSPSTPGSFSNTQFSINPGLSGVFAWLSQVAVNYDEYSLDHLVFHYKPVISQASQSGSMGAVVLAANYNAGAPKFETFREMVEYLGSMETRICDEAMFGVECDPKKHSSQDVEYVRAGSVPPGEDIKTYDLGTFQIATSDIDAGDYPAGTLLGHLYVEYEVTLGKPKLYSALGKSILCDIHRGTTGTTPALPYGTAPLKNSGNSIGASLSKTAKQFTLPDNFYGRILVTYYAEGASIGLATDVLAPEPGSNITQIPILGDDGISSKEQLASTTAASAQALFDVTVASDPGANQIQVNLVGGTINGFNLEIIQCNPLLTSEWV